MNYRVTRTSDPLSCIFSAPISNVLLVAAFPLGLGRFFWSKIQLFSPFHITGNSYVTLLTWPSSIRVFVSLFSRVQCQRYITSLSTSRPMDRQSQHNILLIEGTHQPEMCHDTNPNRLFFRRKTEICQLLEFWEPMRVRICSNAEKFSIIE